MYIVFLRFSENKAQAKEFMADHNAWLNSGFEKGVFMLSGTIMPPQGGAIIANDIEFTDLQNLVNEDPFVQRNIVTAEIVEIAPSKTDSRLDFLSH